MTASVSKEVALTAATAALSLILFVALSLALTASLNNVPLLIALGIGAVIWTIVTAITLFSVPHWWAVGAIAGIATASTVIAGMSWGALGGGILLGLSCVAARQAFARDRANTRRFRTVHVFRAGTKLLVIGLVLASAGLSLPFIEGSLKKDGFQVNADQMEVVLRPLQPVVDGLLPNVKVESNIDDLINNQLRQEGVDPSSVSQEQRNEIRRQIGQQLDVEVTGHDSLGDIVANRINTTLEGVIQTNALTVALVAVILAFLTIRALIPLITWVLLLGIAGGLWLSRRVGLLQVKTETIEVETLTL